MNTIIAVLAYPFVLVGALIVSFVFTFALAWRLTTAFVEKQMSK